MYQCLQKNPQWKLLNPKTKEKNKIKTINEQILKSSSFYTNTCCKLDDFSIDFENTAKIYLKAETRYDINKFRQVAARLKKGDIPVIVQYDKKLYALDEYVNADFESYMELLNVAGENNIIFK